MSKRLLVVDDALIIREMIKDAARNSGWEIVGEASNGLEAIEQYEETTPDVVTLDLIMPEYDGLHALEGIMKIDPAAHILVVSAIDQTDILKEALRMGAADLVVKPFEKERLASALDKLAAHTASTASN